MASPKKRAAAADADAAVDGAGASGKYRYTPGFGGYFTSEALPNALPPFQNTPQVCPYGLYAEQINGTAFTKPRHQNLFRCPALDRASGAVRPETAPGADRAHP